jgi:hypothetical protein
MMPMIHRMGIPFAVVFALALTGWCILLVCVVLYWCAERKRRREARFWLEHGQLLRADSRLQMKSEVMR